MPEGPRVFVRRFLVKYQHFYFFEVRYESCQDFSNLSSAFHQHVSFRDVWSLRFAKCRRCAMMFE
jgi:hypothetical protein